jgi:hypothetical protein
MTSEEKEIHRNAILAFQRLRDDLHQNKELLARIRNDLDFATDLYRSFCNLILCHEIGECSMSWRYAGGFVAELRSVGEDYLDFYCAGSEGSVSPEVETEMAKLGWSYKEWPNNTAL